MPLPTLSIQRRRIWPLLLLVLPAAVVLIGSNRPARAGGSGYTVLVGSSPKISGPILTDSHGMTLYVNAVDQPDHSDCYSSCWDVWPPLEPVLSPAAAAGIFEAIPPPALDPMAFGSLTVIRRLDFGYQIAYNDRPLYQYSRDTSPGDVNGQGVDGGLWLVARPAPPPSTPTPPPPFGPPPPTLGQQPVAGPPPQTGP